MGKKKRRAAKSGPLVVEAELVWQARKPRYSGYACGYGKHGDSKYNRARAKDAWRRDIDSRSPGKGLLPFCALLSYRLDCPIRCIARTSALCALGCGVSYTDVFLLEGRSTVYGLAQDLRRAYSAY